MMRRAKVNYLDMEDMMGHKVGLEKHYERYLEEDFERFSEYQQAIPFLTISEEEQLRFENELKQKQLDELEQNSPKFRELSQRLDRVENGIEARQIHFRDSRYKADGPKLQAFLMMLQFWFELRATESEKREVWKRIREAKESGKNLDVSVFGKPNFDWNNLPTICKE